jgi:transcriptional regulator with XRE-family HTH domain
MRNELKTLRESRKISAAELGRKIGRSAAHIAAIEDGSQEFIEVTLLRTCAALNCTADEIFAIPVRGINKKTCDPVLLDAAVWFLLLETKRRKIALDRKRIARQATLFYRATVALNLNLPQSRLLAKLLTGAGGAA